MEQHPVPQNISSYEFRLVGDMTLKQFFQLAGGVGVAVLFYNMPLPFFLKWPLIVLAVVGGILLAFVPVSGRPFSQWLMAFFKAVYSPTEYYWHATLAQPMEPPADTSSAPASPLDNFESQIVSRVSQLFSPHSPVTPVETIAPAPTPVAEVIPPQPPTPTSIPSIAPIAQTDYIKAEVKPTTTQLEPKKPIMIAEIVDATPPPTPTPITPVQANPPPPAHQFVTFTSTAPPVGTVAPPATPAPTLTPSNYPNMISGLVVSSTDQALEGVIVEISSSATGIPVRALRSNKLGQFQTATPVASDVYNIMADKEGLTFDPVSLVCEDKIVTPILLKAK